MFTRRMTRAAIAAALTIASVAGVQLANPGTASARCSSGHPVTTDLKNTANVRVAWETPKAGTCVTSDLPDGDGYYQTTLSAATGYTPELYTQNGGYWILRHRGAGAVTIQSDSHQTQEFLCAEYNADGARWCGTGAHAAQPSGAWFCWQNSTIAYLDNRYTTYKVPAGYAPCLGAVISPGFGLLNSPF